MSLIIKKVKSIGKKEFVAAVFDLDHKTFVVYVVILNISFDVGIQLHLLKNT